MCGIQFITENIKYIIYLKKKLALLTDLFSFYNQVRSKAQITIFKADMKKLKNGEEVLRSMITL